MAEGLLQPGKPEGVHRLAAAGSDPESGQPDRSAEKCVILLHGLWRTQLSMLAVDWKLERAGYQVVNRSYSSLTRSIQENALLAVTDGVRECRERNLQTISFVTHSLGGILLRQYLSQYAISGLHRVVMMGPPNQGSALADYVVSLEFLDHLAPQALEQLGTGEKSVPLRLGPVAFELGVIAGNSHRRDFLPGLPEGPGDGTVAVKETRVPGMADFIELPVSHTLMMWDDEVLNQVLYFLRHGRFFRGADGAVAGQLSP
jgi:pimeloyl-ACP methyl ester carboxylesterase